jgi:hypothetical protein
MNTIPNHHRPILFRLAEQIRDGLNWFLLRESAPPDDLDPWVVAPPTDPATGVLNPCLACGSSHVAGVDRASDCCPDCDSGHTSMELGGRTHRVLSPAQSALKRKGRPWPAATRTWA